MACSTGCPTPGAHGSYGECMRSKSTKVAYANSANNMDYSAQRAWDKELDSYREAKAEGLQPASTKQRDIDAAKRISDATGTPFQAA